jgi:hypothetical protein
MSNPAEDIPSNCFLGESDVDFELGTLRLGVARASEVGTMVQLANQLHGSRESMKATVAVAANVHSAPTVRTMPLQNAEFPKSEIRVERPSVGHPTNIRVVSRSFS